MANIVDSLKEFITPELIFKAARSFGESNSAITKGIDSLIPTILGGLAQKSNDTNAFSGIYDMIKNGAKHPSLLDNLGSLIGGGILARDDPKDLSGRLMSSLLGNKVGGVLDLVSSVAGLKRSSSSGLMGLVGPLVMNYLGRIIKYKMLDAVGLGKYLRNDLTSIAKALPFGMDDLLNLGFAKNAGYKVARTVDIIDALKEFITPELIVKAAHSYGESNSAITKGIDIVIPTIIGGLVQKSNDTNAFSGIYDMIKNGAKHPSLLDNLGSLIGGGILARDDPKDLSGRLMSSLLGNKVGGVLDLVSSVAGLKRSSSSGLMGLVGPLVMNYLGRIIKYKRA